MKNYLRTLMVLTVITIGGVFAHILPAQAQITLPGGAAPCTDLKNCGEIVTKPRIMESIGIKRPGIPLIPMGKFSDQKSDVKDAASAIQGSIGSGEVPKGENFHGNDDFDGTWDDDLETALDNFDQCQSDDNQHTLDDLTDWIYPLIYGAISRATGWGDGNYVLGACMTHYGYSGPNVGSCWWAQKEDCDCPFDCTFCGCVYGASWTTWDLIEYYYPTGRVNVSEQPFQSRYIQPEDYDAGKDFMESAGYQQIADSMESAVTKLQNAVATSVPIVTGKSFTPTWGTMSDRALNARDSAITALQDLPSNLPAGFTEDPRFANPANRYMEGRYYTEDEVDGVAGDFLAFANIPHYPKYDFDARVLTDPAPDSDAWAASVILQESDFDEGRWGPYLTPSSEVKGARCIENNKTMFNSTQKTPTDLWGSIGAASDHDFKDLVLELIDSAYINPIVMWTQPQLIGDKLGLANNNVCLDGVGEIFPYTHYSRLHPTDQVFASAIKMAQYTDAKDHWASRGLPDDFLLTLILKLTPYHTFVHQWDKFILLNDDGFKDNGLSDEIGDKCQPMEKKMTDLGIGGFGADEYLAKRNVEMKADTVKKVKGASEATFEIYTLFKGCFAGGIGQQNIPFGFAMDNFALAPHGWTEYNWGGPPRDDCTDVTSGPCWQDHDEGILPKGLMRAH